jgi:hypothetical protein
MSLIGGADNYWSLSRQPMSEDATMKVTGRDIDHEQDIAMQFKDGFWTIVGDAATVKMSKERQSIVEVLRGSEKALTPKQIASALDKNYHTVKNLVRKMFDSHILIQPIEGYYTLSPTYSTTTVVPVVSVVPVVPVVSVVSGGETTRDYGSSNDRSLSQVIDKDSSYGSRDYETTETTVTTHKAQCSEKERYPGQEDTGIEGEAF